MKIKKYIQFYQQSTMTTAETIMSNNPSVQNPLKENFYPKQQLSTSQQNKIDIVQTFMRLNQIRCQINFRHYVCVETFTKHQQVKNLSLTELIYEKFLIFLAYLVKSS